MLVKMRIPAMRLKVTSLINELKINFYMEISILKERCSGVH